MRKQTILVILVLAISISAVWAADNGVKQQMTSAVEAVRPALVRIFVVSAQYDQGREKKVESAGSGVIISADGYAVTNHHVVENAKQIMVTMPDKTKMDAKLIATDPLADIAVIKLQPPVPTKFPFAEFGDSSKLEVGDRVFAMGSPLAISQSVTMGIISNTEMVMPDRFGPDKMEMEGEDVGSIVKWIGHDALIEPGNSGGPLVSTEGKIVGINEISYGLAGAIPSNIANQVSSQLIKHERVIRAWFGIDVQPLLESSGLKSGVLVGGVLENSPADKAGLKSDDVILSINGQQVTGRFKEEIPVFNLFVANLEVGKAAELKVLRNGKETVLSIIPIGMTKALDKEQEIKTWGINGKNITYMMQKEMQLDSADGVLVTSVLPSGPVGDAKPTLNRNDIIVRVNDTHIKDIAHLKELSASLTQGQADGVLVTVEFLRKTKKYATVVNIGKNIDSDSGYEVSKAWIGIDTQVLTRELAQALGVKGMTGVRVTQVYPNTNAAKAGVLVGDIIVKVDGEEIPAEQIGDEDVFPSTIRQYDIGISVKLGIIRDGKPMSIDITLEKSPKSVNDYPKYTNDDFGFTARDLAFTDKSDKEIAKLGKGVIVESVEEGSWAALGGLRSDDVIMQIDTIEIANLSELETTIKKIADKKPKAIVFKIKRGIHTQYVEMKASWSDI